MTKTLTLPLILIVAAAIGTAPATRPTHPTPPPFASLPANVQQDFKNHADQFVMIEGELWSVMVQWQRDRMKKEHARPASLAPYLDKSAPYYWRVSDGKQCRDLKDVAMAMKRFVVISGHVKTVRGGNLVLQTQSGRWVQVSGVEPWLVNGVIDHLGQSIFLQFPCRPLDKNEQSQQTPLYHVAHVKPRKITAKQLYEHFQTYGIHNFPNPVPSARRKTVNRALGGNGFQIVTSSEVETSYIWHNRPIPVRMPSR